MKRVLFFLLAIAALLSAVSCSSASLLTAEDPETADAPATEKKTSEPAAAKAPEKKTEPYQYPVVSDLSTPEKLAALPLANASMTTDELRQLCVDFFNLQLNFCWTGDETYNYVITSANVPRALKKGNVHKGLPYVSSSHGNLYRALEHYDPATGILTVSDFKGNAVAFGNACSSGAFWGWGRVVNSADLGATEGMVQANGYLPVGPYTYPADMTSYYIKNDPNAKSTETICKENGEETIYESYAAMKVADGIIFHLGKSKSGHVRMCSEAPVVVRNEDGTINPSKSYAYFTEQVSKTSESKQANGVNLVSVAGYHNKYTFKDLYAKYYIPFTFKELLGTDPVEPSVTTLDLAGESVTPAQLKGATVTTSYFLSDVYLTVTDDGGQELYRNSLIVSPIGKRSAALTDLITAELDQYAGKGNTVTVFCQISTGEKPTVLTAALAA